MFTLTLEREEPISTGSNIGVMTLGGLPSGISNSSLTWVPVQTYAVQEAFSDIVVAPNTSAFWNEVSAITPHAPRFWQVALDAVYTNGQKSPSTLNSTGLSLSAVLDAVSVNQPSP